MTQKRPSFLSRLHVERIRLIDLVLVAALLGIAIIWTVNRTNSAGSIEDVDADAWRAAMTQLADALDAGELDVAKAALQQLAVLAEPAKDDAAAGIRGFADALTGTDLAAVETALAALDPVPRSTLFQGFYYDIWTPLLVPPFPDAPPAPGAEWAQVDVGAEGATTAQSWGTTIWSAAEGAATAAISIPDIALDGTLVLADGDNGLTLTLDIGGIYPDATIADVSSFWTADGTTRQTGLAGTISSTDGGVIVMTLAADSREDNLSRIRSADEIGIVITFSDRHSLLLRFQLGDSGRAAVASAFPAVPTN